MNNSQAHYFNLTDPIPDPKSNNLSVSSEIFSSKLTLKIKTKSSVKVRQVFNHLLQMGFEKKRLVYIFGLKSPFDELTEAKEQMISAMIDLYLASELDYAIDISVNSDQDYPNEEINFIKKRQSLSLTQNLHEKPTRPRKLSSSFADPINIEKLINPINYRECVICYNAYEKNEISTIPKCDHEFCHTCLRYYLTNLIDDGRVYEIKCPAMDCKQVLSETTIQDFLKDAEYMKKYRKFKKTIEINLNPHLRWCIRPGCEEWIEGSPNKPKTQCKKCNQIMCFNCMNPWHEGKTCQQAIDLDYQAYTEKNLVKKCPKCNSRIEKNEGCNHMNCTQCRFEFCWLCGGKYAPGHYEWYNLFGCPNLAYARINESKVGRAFFWIKRLGIIFLTAIVMVILCILLMIFVPLGIVGLAIISPVLIYRKICRPSLNFKGISLGILVFFLGLPLVPFILVFMIFPGTCMIICCRDRVDDIFN